MKEDAQVKDRHAEESSALRERIRELEELVAGQRRVEESFSHRVTACKKAGEAAERSRDYYHKLIDEFPMPVWRTNREGACDYFNNAWMEFTGQAGETGDFCTWSAGIHPDDRRSCADAFSKAFAARVPFEMEYRRRCSDGSYRNVIDTGIPFHAPDGEFVGYVGTFRDITRRTQAELALRDSELRYRTIFENTGAATLLIGEDETIALVNGEFEKVSGFARQEVEGRRKWHELVVPEERERLQHYQRLRRLDPTTVPRKYESRFLRKDGAVRDGLVMVDLIPGTKKSLVSFLDITARKQLEEETYRHEQVFRTLVEHSPDLIARYDLEFRFMYVNPLMERVSGFPKERSIGRTAREAGLPVEFSDYMDAAFQNVLSSNRETRMEFSFKDDTGHRYYLGRVVPEFSRDGKMVSFLAIAHDMTDRKRAEDALVLRNEQLETLSQAVQQVNTVLESRIVLRNLVQCAMRLVGATAGSAGLFVDGRMVFTEYNERDVLTPMSLSFEPGEGVPGHIIKTKQPYVTNDAAHDPHVLPQLRERFGFHNLADVPIMGRKGELLGCFEMHNTVDRRPFDERDVIMLQGLAAGAAVALENARIMEERDRVEEALRSSEKTYRTIFENTGAVTVIIEEDTTLALVNTEFESVLGYRKAEAEGKMSWKGLVHPDDFERMLRYHRSRRIDQKGAPHSYEARLVDREGNIRNAILFIAMIPGTKRSVVSVIDITASKQAEEALLRRNRQLEVLSRTTQQINSVLEAPAILRNLVSAGMELVEASGGAAALYRNGNMLFSEYNRNGTVTPMRETLGEGDGVPGYVIKTMRPYLTNDAENDPRVDPARRKLLGFRRLVNVPVISREDELLGCVELHNHDGRLLDQTDVTLLQGLAASAAVALENAQALEERRRAEAALRESEERYRTIFEHSGTVLMILEENGTISLVNDEFEQLFGYPESDVEGRKGFGDLIHPDDADLVQRYRRGLRTGEIPVPARYEARIIDRQGNVKNVIIHASFIPGTSQSIKSIIDITGLKRTEEQLARAREVAEQRLLEADEGRMVLQALMDNIPEGIIIADAPDLRIRAVSRFGLAMTGRSPEILERVPYREHPERWKLFHQGGLRLALTEELPLARAARYGETIINEEWVMQRADGMMLQILVNAGPIRDRNGKVTGGVVTWRDITDRKQAQEKLQESYGKLERAIDGIINAMTKIVETRDPYTVGHEKRVAQLAVAIAGELGLPPEQANGIRIAALIHDIGKLYVPAEILSKPGQLSEVEFSIIKTHPKASYEILEMIEFPWPVAQVAGQHQERFDGSGYPLGLKDGEILLEARIISVADVVEAMTFNRPYKPVGGLDQALSEIERQGGKLFDQEVVDACLKLFRERGFKFAEEG